MGEEPEPQIIRTVETLGQTVDDWRREGASVALVPTMGALHEGHLALVRAAQAQAPRVVVTIFVNPTQFAPGEDFDLYPRTEKEDLAALASLPGSVDAVFAPAASAMYPPGFATKIHVGGPADGLETDHRPHFFEGVATVVAKLLLGARTDQAFFGEKDYQQLLVVRRMATDLNIATRIVSVPTVREPDGLALSSRNRRLSPDDRKKASLIYRAMTSAAASVQGGGAPAAAAAEGRMRLAENGFRVDYFEIRDAETLRPPSAEGGALRVLVAARLGEVRLIDNLPV